MSKTVVIPECNRDVGGVKEEISLSPPEKKDGAIRFFSRLLRLDTSNKKASAPSSPNSTEPSTTYFGVYIPCEIKKGPDEEAIHVYKNKSEALELVRRYKSSRFKVFKNRQDAISFALRGAEPESTDCTDGSLVGEKPYPFKGPSPQDMVALRKSIEAGMVCVVRDHVWDNPRFLISSGNTPAIMQEGSRYNALHIAAKAMNAELCNLVLNTVGNPAFVQTLYGSDADPESCKEFASILVDRYLNTPDKAMNETPLHFAAKFGAEEVVDVLTAFPQCDKGALNKYGEQPKDIIGKRSSTCSPEAVKRISSMLESRYYVPVLHAEDGAAAPTIGRPFTPGAPPEINPDPLSPRCEIRAFAGPMGAGDAEAFRRKWKTPPRSAHPPSPAKPFRLREMSKGLEAVGRNLAEQMKVGWKEYWPFLDTFTDIRSPEGLQLLESYLKAKFDSACSFAYNDSCAELSPGLSLSRISHAEPSTPAEALSPISDLCVAMRGCNIADRSTPFRRTDPVLQRLCRQPSKAEEVLTPPPNHTVSRLLCIERTCQVFAKRIADALVFSLTAEPEVAGDALKSEAKHLQHTISTYKADERFQTVEFALAHSRLAQLVVHNLRQRTTDLDDIASLVEFLAKLRCPNDDIFSSDEDREPRSRAGRARAGRLADQHVRCVASLVCREAGAEGARGPAASEADCSRIWAEARRCRCEWRVDTLDRNSKKNASFRKNRSLLSTSPKSESFIRRLSFDHDIGTGDGRQLPRRARSVVNSPAGDAALYTLDVAKCTVVPAEISDDESVSSDQSESYHTAADSDSDRDPMEEASDRALAEPFIYGEEPTKMDRLVFEALSSHDISPAAFPSVYRWRHTVALYSPAERDSWVPATSPTGVVCVPARSPAGSPRRRPPARSTPHRELAEDRAVPLQVSNWLRVTGPNSPRSSLANKHIGHNVSFGF